MTPLIPIHLVIDLDHDGQAIAGRVSEPAGGSIGFSGWLGLAAAIDELAAAARAAQRPAAA